MLSDIVSGGFSNAPVEVEEIDGEAVKFATNRDAYVLNHLASLQGSKFIRGDNHKSAGDQAFKVNVPVTVIVAMDGRYDHAARAPEGFAATGESIGFDHSGRTSAEFRFPLYAKDFNAGLAKFQFRHFEDNDGMAGVFVMERTLALSDVAYSGTTGNMALEVEEVTGETITWASDRTFELTDLKSLQGSKFIRGGHDERPAELGFKVNVPVTVVVAMSSRHLELVPAGFTATGETIANSIEDSRMPLYAKDFPAGLVDLQFGTNGFAAGIFVIGAA